MELHQLTAHELFDLHRQGRTTHKEIFQSLLAQIQQVDENVHAFVRVNDQVDSVTFSDKVKIPIPVAIKDNLCILDQETTCCSKILRGFRPPYDATVIDKLRAAGASFQGHTNMDEFAFGSSTENSCYGPTRNPWNYDCVPGGSSGGSAAAVAAHEAIWALGSDTGGSIRQPASFCGVVGVKPTYGRVSRYGLIAFASSLDQIGPITKDVTDAAILLNIIAGYDPRDSTSVDMPVPDYTKSLTGDVKGIKIGIPKEYFIDGLDAEVEKSVREAMAVLEKRGAQLLDVSLPHTEYSIATYYIIATAEASSNLARYDGVRYGMRKTPDNVRKSSIVDMFEETRDEGFGKESKRRIMLGTYSLSSGYYDAYYLRGQKVRTLIKNDFDHVFRHCDAVLGPTSPSTAFRMGEKTADPLSMYLSDIFTNSTNLSGIPGISLPCGFSKAGLPIGLQIMTKPFDEPMMFRIAHAYEQSTEWHKHKVSLTS